MFLTLYYYEVFLRKRTLSFPGRFIVRDMGRTLGSRSVAGQRSISVSCQAARQKGHLSIPFRGRTKGTSQYSVPRPDKGHLTSGEMA